VKETFTGATSARREKPVADREFSHGGTARCRTIARELTFFAAFDFLVVDTRMPWIRALSAFTSVVHNHSYERPKAMPALRCRLTSPVFFFFPLRFLTGVLASVARKSSLDDLPGLIPRIISGAQRFDVTA